MIKPLKNTPFNSIILVLVIWITLTGIQTGDPFTDDLKSRLIQYNQSFHVEKTYVLTDRFIYRPGEDLWFTGFVSSNEKSYQQAYSEDFLIRLLDSKGEEIVGRRYPLVNNQASGRISIPRSIIPGKYLLVAYSGWMKNRCPREAFRKEILISKYYEKRFQLEMLLDKIVYAPYDTLNAIVKILDPSGNPVIETPFEYMIGTVSKSEFKGNGQTDIKGKARITLVVPPSDEVLMLTLEIKRGKYAGDYSQIIPSLAGKPFVNFYPEGGSMVKGLNNNLAFNVVNQYNIPMSVKGEIVDKAGNSMQMVNTNSKGQGVFAYTPGADSCFLRIIMPEAQQISFPIPDARPDGIIIQLQEAGADSVTFTIRASGNNQQTTYWIAVMENQVVWDQTIYFTDSALVNVPVRNFQPGLMQVSVFDKDQNCVAERLVHLQSRNEEMKVKTDHQTYHNRQRVNLLMEFPERLNNTSLTLSVALDNLAHHVQTTNFKTMIQAERCNDDSTLLRQLDGYTDLDLLTTGYRPVNWQDVLGTAYQEPPYLPHDGLTGRVFDRKENPAKHAKVRITHFPNFRSYETQTDDRGIFQIAFGTDIIDYKYLDIDAYDASGKTNLDVSVDQDYFKDLQQSVLYETYDTKKQKVWDVIRYADPDLVYMLRYGPGKFKKSAPDSRKKYDPNQYAKYTDILDIIQDIKPYSLVNDKIIFHTGETPGSEQMKESIIVINGKLKGDNIHALRNILPSDITNINISNSSLDVHKYTPLNFNAVIEITTIQGMYRYRQNPDQVGSGILNTGREFYSPDYAVESSAASDNRKTLYWNPKILMRSGNPVLISFYTSDVKGKFRGRLIGVDNRGIPIEYEFTFMVE